MREHIKNGEYPNDLRFILLLYTLGERCGHITPDILV